MAADTYSVKKNDLDPPFQAQLLDGNNKPVIVQAGDVVRFHMAPRVKGLRAVINQIGAIDASMAGGDSVAAGRLGYVIYTWQAGDTVKAGLYDVEVEVTFLSTGKPRTFPSGGYFVVEVVEDLA